MLKRSEKIKSCELRVKCCVGLIVWPANIAECDCKAVVETPYTGV